MVLNKNLVRLCLAVVVTQNSFSSCKGASSLILTTNLFTSGSYCAGRSVRFTCEGRETSFSFFWKNGSADIAQYAFHELSTEFPITLPVRIPIQGVVGEVTTANLVSASKINIVSNLIVVDVSLINGYSIYCEDGSGTRSRELNIHVVDQDVAPSPFIDFCPVTFTTGELSIALELDHSFIIDYAVESYHVSVEPVTSSCSNDQLSPNDRYSCTGLSTGTNYMFNVSAVNCVDQIGDAYTFTVHPQSPRITDYIDVRALYKCGSYCKLAELAEIIVQWEEMTQPVISEGCSFNDELDYTVALRDNGAIVEQRVISSDSCVNVCQTSFVFSSSRSYSVSVTATNGIGLSSVTVESPIIDGADQHFTYTLTLSKGTVFVLCMPLLKSVMDNSSNCSIQYTKDSSFNNLSKPVIGPFNIPFAIPIKETTLSVYYLQAAVVVNSSLVITVRSSKVFTSTNGSGNRSSEDDSSTSFLTPATAPPGTVKVYQVALLCLFLGISLLALVISIGIIVFLVHKLKKKSYRDTLAVTYDTVSITSRKAEPSSYHEIQLNHTQQTPTVGTTSRDVKRDAFSVVYDEIPMFMTNHSIAATSKSEMSLKPNSAYQSSSDRVL